MRNAAYWIDHLQMKPHPEGGFYKEVYRSDGFIQKECLPSGFSGNRNFCTSIYFLLRSRDRSMFHRIKSDEIWHFYAGASLSIYVLKDGGIQEHKLGCDLTEHENLQVVIPANSWFGALVNKPDSYVLAGCTVSPGFDFDDFELADRRTLQNQFPKYHGVIHRLT